MEKFEIEDEKTLETFNNFVGKAKDAFTTLVENIKENIKRYEQSVEDVEKEIADTESSREKCEHEITKMEGKIATIKDAIENVENTYKKMVDAYSQTSKGETKDIYSDIISGAKANCEKDVEKNRSEIARLNSDIEAIKNNIQEFNRMIDFLNKTLDSHKLELSKYNKAFQLMEKVSDKTSADLDDIDAITQEKPKSSTKKREVLREEKKVEIEPVKEEKVEFEPIKEDVREKIKDEIVPEIKVEKPVEEVIKPEVDAEESLQRIYDLTGYKPKKEERTYESSQKTDSPIYEDNLENLFLNTQSNVKTQESIKTFENTDMSEWEKILNDGDSLDDIKVGEDNVKKSIVDNMTDTVDQLLKPYGTSFNRLKSLVSDKIVYEDGTILPFELTNEDIIKAVNDVDGNDLKKMKTVGPEITLLRKVKSMKEGK